MFEHNTVIHADCIKGMAELQSEAVDFVLTMPESRACETFGAFVGM